MDMLYGNENPRHRMKFMVGKCTDNEKPSLLFKIINVFKLKMMRSDSTIIFSQDQETCCCVKM